MPWRAVEHSESMSDKSSSQGLNLDCHGREVAMLGHRRIRYHAISECGAMSKDESTPVSVGVPPQSHSKLDEIRTEAHTPARSSCHEPCSPETEVRRPHCRRLNSLFWSRIPSIAAVSDTSMILIMIEAYVFFPCCTQHVESATE